MSEARADILARIRAALAGVAAVEPAAMVRPQASLSRAALLERFTREAESVGARVVRAERARSAEELSVLLAEWKAKSVVLSDAPLLASLDLERALRERGFEISLCRGFVSDASELLAADAGVTDADYGLADTGTLVLLTRPEQGRAVSLLPPVHVAILPAERLVEDLESLFEAMRPAEQARAASAITFITGPSRTADIEQTLTVGVHGPGKLGIILLE